MGQTHRAVMMYLPNFADFEDPVPELGHIYCLSFNHMQLSPLKVFLLFYVMSANTS